MTTQLTPNEQATQTKILAAHQAIEPLANQRPAVTIELNGTWIWVSGTRKGDKELIDALKAAGYKFSGKKMKWYFAGTPFKFKGRRSTPHKKIRQKYGSVMLKDAEPA